MSEPERYLNELKKAKLLNYQNEERINATQQGWIYLRTRILPFPINQLLEHANYRAQLQDKERSSNASATSLFIEALRKGASSIDDNDLPAIIRIDEIDSFAAVAFVDPEDVKTTIPVRSSEEVIKRAICAVLDETPTNDWGGEQNDIFTTRLVFEGRHVTAAFFLKGPSVRGSLTLAKCGKNGDQIQRLFQASADIYVLQFNGEIDQRVIQEARDKVFLCRLTGHHRVCCAVIDGLDTARFLAAYGN